MSEWQPIETAPKEPLCGNWMNAFSPRDMFGPLVQLSIPFRPTPKVTVGWWVPDHGCWRHLQDDGPKDIQPTHWKPLDEPPAHDPTP